MHDGILSIRYFQLILLINNFFPLRVVKASMVSTFVYFLAFYVPALMTIAMWAITPFMEEKMRLPISAW